MGPPVHFDTALLERRFALADRVKSKVGAHGLPVPGVSDRLKSPEITSTNMVKSCLTSGTKNEFKQWFVSYS